MNKDHDNTPRESMDSPDTPEGENRPRSSHVQRSSERPEPFSLEDDSHHGEPRRDRDDAPASPGAGSEREPETCPNCLAPMHERGSLVCLRCGYDLKTLRAAKTIIAKPRDDDDEDDDDEADIADAAASRTPVCQEGLGGYNLPIALAAVAGIILLIGVLAGWPGLFPSGVVRAAGDEPIGFIYRLQEVARLALLIAVLTGCGIGGMLLLAAMNQRPAGDLTLIAARMLGIVVTVRIITFLHLGGPAWVGWMLESLLQFALFVGLAFAIFRLHPRNALLLGGWTLLLICALLLISHIVVWVL